MSKKTKASPRSRVPNDILDMPLAFYEVTIGVVFKDGKVEDQMDHVRVHARTATEASDKVTCDATKGEYVAGVTLIGRATQ